MIMKNSVKILAFDADDTLWENEPFFRAAEAIWAKSLEEYGEVESLSERLYEVEERNMPEFGYGAKPFGMNLLDATLEITEGKFETHHAKAILEAVRSILVNPAKPLEGVELTLRKIKASGKYKMVLITKGDLLDQENKIARSGLGDCFDYIKIVSKKYQNSPRFSERVRIAPKSGKKTGSKVLTIFWIKHIIGMYPIIGA